jgi:hypothetical protein
VNQRQTERTAEATEGGMELTFLEGRIERLMMGC